MNWKVDCAECRKTRLADSDIAKTEKLERLQTEAVEAQSTISDLRAETERLRLAGEEELATERARFKTLEEAKEAELLQERTKTNKLLQVSLALKEESQRRRLCS